MIEPSPYRLLLVSSNANSPSTSALSAPSSTIAAASAAGSFPYRRNRSYFGLAIDNAERCRDLALFAIEMDHVTPDHGSLAVDRIHLEKPQPCRERPRIDLIAIAADLDRVPAIRGLEPFRRIDAGSRLFNMRHDLGDGLRMKQSRHTRPPVLRRVCALTLTNGISL